MYTTSFRVVQLMYRTPLGFLQSVPNLFVGVQTWCFDHYTSCGVGNVHDKVQDCTVDVQAATMFLTISTLCCCRCTNHPLGPLHFMRSRYCTRQVLGLYSWCTGRHRVFCNLPNLAVDVQTCGLNHYTSCGVYNAHYKFQGCTVDVQAATRF